MTKASISLLNQVLKDHYYPSLKEDVAKSYEWGLFGPGNAEAAARIRAMSYEEFGQFLRGFTVADDA